MRLRVRARRRDAQTSRSSTIASPDEPGRPIIGVQVEQSADIELPVDVEIDLGGVGGPSAGLAFALDIVEELGAATSTAALDVAATGEIELDGAVAPDRRRQAEGDRREARGCGCLPRPRWG